MLLAKLNHTSQTKVSSRHTAFPWFMDDFVRTRALGAKNLMRSLSDFFLSKQKGLSLFLQQEGEQERKRVVRIHSNLMQDGFAKSHPLKLLIVEDNKINTKVLVKMLERLGYDPGTAINGEDCLAKLAEEHYDMIFMDLQMPVMDGFEAARRVLKISSSSAKPVFITALTANTDMQNKASCEEIGLHDFVAKPVNPKKIMDVISHGYSWLQERVVDGEKEKAE